MSHCSTHGVNYNSIECPRCEADDRAQRLEDALREESEAAGERAARLEEALWRQREAASDAADRYTNPGEYTCPYCLFRTLKSGAKRCVKCHGEIDGEYWGREWAREKAERAAAAELSRLAQIKADEQRAAAAEAAERARAAEAERWAEADAHSGVSNFFAAILLVLSTAFFLFIMGSVVVGGLFVYRRLHNSVTQPNALPATSDTQATSAQPDLSSFAGAVASACAMSGLALSGSESGDTSPATALGCASAVGDSLLVSRLIEANVDVNQGFGYKGGDDPLIEAARHGHLSVVRLLLQSGAAMDAEDEIPGRTALAWAASSGDTNMIRFLAEAGASLTGFYSGGAQDEPPLYAAAEGGKERSAQLLLDLGADPREVYQGHTALDVARDSGYVGVIAAITSSLQDSLHSARVQLPDSVLSRVVYLNRPGVVDRPAQLQTCPLPDHPGRLSGASTPATVGLRFIVGIDGIAEMESVRLLGNEPRALYNAAVEIITHCVFSPAVSRGRNVRQVFLWSVRVTPEN